MVNPFDDFILEPQQASKVYKESKDKNPFAELEKEESWGKWLARTLYQIPSGIAQATTFPLDLLNMLAYGEAMDSSEIENFRRVAEKYGVPFDEERYAQGAAQATELFPTQSNIERGIENLTGAPLTPKTNLQKGLKFASTAGKIIPGKGVTSTGEQFTRNIPTRAALGGLVEGARELMIHQGVPEPVADIASFGWLGPVGTAQAAKNIDLPTLSTKTKPSGLTERGFESLKSPTEVSHSKLGKINDKLQSDFERLSDKIVAESPIGETAERLRAEPGFKQESKELLNQAQNIADTLPNKIKSTDVKKELIDTAAKKKKGYAPDEYDKSYSRYVNDAVKEVPKGEITAGQLVEQYRKNNRALEEYFEPGSSKALNRAKKDALLDQNRAIASMLEKYFPESELATVFKEGNARWTKIMDAEAVDSFVSDIFSEKGINYKKLNDFFDKNGYGFIFKRALGEDGYKNFQQLVKDMLTTETPYKMLKIARSKGYNDLYNTASSFMLHPKLGFAKIGYDFARRGFRAAVNTLLDKPKLGFTWKKGVENLKKGNFAQAEKAFQEINQEVKLLHPDEIVSPEKKLSTNTFKTEKGSTYTVNENKTTTRNKKYRPEHGEKEQGIQDTSEKTWYLSKEDIDKLSEFQSQGSSKRIIELPDGRIGVMYESGKDAGKIESRTLVNPNNAPEIGLYPVESWDNGKKIHFGNKIIEFNPKEKPVNLTIEPKQLEAPKKQIPYKETKTPVNKEEAVKKFNKRKEKTLEKPKAIELGYEPKESPQTIAISPESELKPKVVTKKKAPKKEKPAENLTEKKIDQLERQDISKKGLKSQKEFILDKLKDVLDNPSKYEGVEKIPLDVPGDGQFKIHNNEKAIKQFMKNVESKWPDKPMKNYTSKKYQEYPEYAYKEYELKQKAERNEYLKKAKEENTKKILHNEVKENQYKNEVKDKIKKTKKLENVEEYYKKIIQNERLKQDIESKKDYGISPTLLGEGMYSSTAKKNMYRLPEHRTTNIKKNEKISKLNEINNQLFKKIEKELEGFPKDIVDKIHEEFFQIPFVNRHAKIDNKKILELILNQKKSQ